MKSFVKLPATTKMKLPEYEYVALLRQPDCWNATRLKKLESFVDQAINDRVAFNFEGIKKERVPHY